MTLHRAELPLAESTPSTGLPRRQGSILMLMIVLLPVLIILAAFSINVAYMQLAKTELMVATDAAARAGGRALSELQDVDAAKAAARDTAAMNMVGGIALQIEYDDSGNEIEFGDSLTPANYDDARFAFTKKNTESIRSGGQTANAIRVTGKRSDGSNTGSLRLPFPSFGMAEEWDVNLQAVAMQVDRDIALVLDRSGSMGWKTYSWPPGYSPWNTTIYNQAVSQGLLTYQWGQYYYASGVSTYDYQDWVWNDYYQLGPPPNSPWEDLKLAVASFLSVLETTVQNEQVSLASYSSSATLDLTLETDYDAVISELNSLSPGGGTAIGYGMQTGIPSLFDAMGRPFAAKTLIVMTDGMHNTGIDPVSVAQDLVETYDITIHTVTFSQGADQDRMEEVAQIGGGNHYHADSGAELVEVFEEIANNLPTIVTQ